MCNSRRCMILKNISFLVVYVSYLSCTFLEFLIIFKFGRELFREPWPPLVKWSWMAAGASTTVALLIWTVSRRNKLKTQ